MNDNIIFALDIGTRKIAGLLMQKTAAAYEVIGSEMIEHDSRAMMDGQIHDIEAVSSTISNIKSTLEEKLQLKLSSVAVAAAGRSLKTARGKAERKRSQAGEITRDEVTVTEIAAVQNAQYNLAVKEEGPKDRNSYICVGYSIIEQRLEDQHISNLVGQMGTHLGIEVIATFLPKVVVDSLFSSLKRADLEIYSLTLEPIAALSVAISPGMRLLNLALVDIGAGTSDIAIIKNGNIFAYAMVPLGGDELTEALASQYLLDFSVAEKAKRMLNKRKKVSMQDILGNKTSVPVDEVLGKLQPVLHDITGSIAEEILSLNHKAPDAVICIGGGSLTPLLVNILADKLGLPPGRVGIRTPDSFDRIHFKADYLRGPQGVTPLGIAYNSFITPPIPFIKVSINKRETVLWNIGKNNVAAALLSSGLTMNNIYGKPGLGKTIKINGQIKTFKGNMGKLPQIKVNGRPVSLQTDLQDGDHIEFTPGESGQDALIKVKDLFAIEAGEVIVNGSTIKVWPILTINGRKASPEDEVPDRASVKCRPANTVADVLTAAGVSHTMLQETVINYFINEQENSLHWVPVKACANGRQLRLNDEIEWGAKITYQELTPFPTLRDAIEKHRYYPLRVNINGTETLVNYEARQVKLNGSEVRPETQIQEGDRITLDTGHSTAILSDIFQVVDIKPVARSRLSIKVDGKEAGYTTPIFENSEIEISWA